MTIFDATHKLFDYFGNNDTFSLEKNFKDIVPITEDEALDKAVVSLALQDLEQNEILKSTTIDKKEYYVLRRAMESFDQSVTITHSTAFMLAQALNEFCETIQDYTDAAEVGNIQEKDVRNLIILNQHHKAELSRTLGESSKNNLGGDSINFDNI